MGKVNRPPKDHPQNAYYDSSKKIWVVNKIKDAQEADKVIWTAPVDSDITIWFPPVPGCDPLGIATRLVKAGKVFGPFTVPPDAAGTYPYSIFIHKSRMMVEGGSGPEIIIVG